MRTVASCILLFFLTIPAIVRAQQISGRVLNEGGKAASHVKVQFKNKQGIVTTNTEGKFTIKAKELPDTLLFYGPGFEPYKVIITDKTISDSSFEVVLLSTRTKASATSVSESTTAPGNAVRNNGVKTGSSGPFKKLVRLDSLPE